MWAAGVVILELYTGGLAGLKEARGDNALDLLETCARHADDVISPVEENGRVLTSRNTDIIRQHEGAGRDGACATRQDGRQPRAKGTAGSDSSRRDGSTNKQVSFRVHMPEGVLAVLRDIFRQKAGDRPESMEVRKTYLT